MAEEQDWNIPDELRSSIFAVYVQGLDYYEMSQALWLPAKYFDAIHHMWHKWVEEDAKNPPEPGVARMIPTEWPGYNDDDDEDEDSTETDQGEEREIILDKFRLRFGNLYELYDKGSPREIVLEIESLYREFFPYYSIREEFNGFRRTACKYLISQGKTELVQIILEDISVGDPNLYPQGLPGSVLAELAQLKRRVTKDPLIHYHPVDEDWPEIDEERK
jgi:hypothetical protein